ncbi:uncharacterized protein LOC133533423 [Cydia pomonella]|uniref:uncharacterized protein LOC133533423 n=1 Tax=Cydia pomonella TaxID=82600 RepID=UPI002ADE75B3|nr:uncharacterized protein LOC133533423 [Cydia pomonella]
MAIYTRIYDEILRKEMWRSSFSHIVESEQNNMTAALIWSGAIILVLAVFGCCGATCQNKTVLCIYSALMGLLAVMDFGWILWQYSTSRNMFTIKHSFSHDFQLALPIALLVITTAATTLGSVLAAHATREAKEATLQPPPYEMDPPAYPLCADFDVTRRRSAVIIDIIS